MKEDWSEYFNKTRNSGPHDLLLKALKYAQVGHALDLGSGALRDSLYLLKLGYEVTAVDASLLMVEEAKAIASKSFHPLVSTFENFAFPQNEYALVSAMFSLPFNPPKTFDTLIKKIKGSLKRDGVLCAVFFGPHDSWNTPKTGLTFRSKDEVVSLLADMKILLLKEEEKDDKTATGEKKHWHTIVVIAQK